jgi:hypothetical protein
MSKDICKDDHRDICVLIAQHASNGAAHVRVSPFSPSASKPGFGLGILYFGADSKKQKTPGPRDVTSVFSAK